LPLAQLKSLTFSLSRSLEFPLTFSIQVFDNNTLKCYRIINTKNLLITKKKDENFS